MKKIFEKYETFFCIFLIVLYLVANSLCLQGFGSNDYRTAIVNTLLSLGLIALMISLKRTSYYGLTRVKDPKKYLFFIPLILIVSVNVWNGININHSYSEIIFHTIIMLNVGFIEEVVFRGFLFKMMAKDNVKLAIAVSTITFGIGHILNLFNGAEVLPTLLQIGYATALGYLFVIIFHKSKSLLPCIIAHSVNNSLSIFNVENKLSLYVIPVVLMIVPTVYAVYINKTVKDD